MSDIVWSLGLCGEEGSRLESCLELPIEAEAEDEEEDEISGL